MKWLLRLLVAASLLMSSPVLASPSSLDSFPVAQEYVAKDSSLLGWWLTVEVRPKVEDGVVTGSTKLFAFIHFTADSGFTSILIAQEKDDSGETQSHEFLRSIGTWETGAGPWASPLLCVRRAGAGDPKCQVYSVMEDKQHMEWGGFLFFKVDGPTIPDALQTLNKSKYYKSS